jgi:hypothetical protein
MLYAIKDLRKGKCAVANDGTKHEIEAVLKHCFPNDNSYIYSHHKYFELYKPNKSKWVSYSETNLLSQSVKEFYKQLQPQFEMDKWYKLEDNSIFIKYSKSDENYIYSDEVVNTNTGSYRSIKNEFWTKGKSRIWILCEDLSLIQPYLPNNHPDKIKTMKKQYLTRKQLIELHKADSCPDWKAIIGCYLNLLVLESDDFKVEIKQHDIDLANQKCKFSQRLLLTKAGLVLNQEIAVCDSKDGDCIKVGNHYYINNQDFITIIKNEHLGLNYSFVKSTLHRITFSPDIKGILVKEPLFLNIKIN